MARALIVGCGCRGRKLGAALAEQGWQIRGTSRSEAGCEAIREAGFEAAQADPDRPGTLLDLVGDVAAVYWLMGTAQDEPEVIAAIHGPRLERFLEKLVDTPVRGFIYEAGGTVQAHRLKQGREVVKEAGERWRIPYRFVSEQPSHHFYWLHSMLLATDELFGQ